MNPTFVSRFDANRSAIREQFKRNMPQEYADIVRAVVELLHDEDEYGSPDPERVHQIDDGDYQGTLVFVVGASGYQPHDYWYIRVWYGSCSGCDALRRILSDGSYGADEPTDQQLDDLMKLALNVVQCIRPMVDTDEVTA